MEKVRLSPSHIIPNVAGKDNLVQAVAGADSN